MPRPSTYKHKKANQGAAYVRQPEVRSEPVEQIPSEYLNQLATHELCQFTGVHPTPTVPIYETFVDAIMAADIGPELTNSLLENLSRLFQNFYGVRAQVMLPIQRLGISHAMFENNWDGHNYSYDLVLRAARGAGKTLAYALPIVLDVIRWKEGLRSTKDYGIAERNIRAVVVCDSDTHCAYVKAVFDCLCEDMGVSAGLSVLGLKIADVERQIKEGRMNIFICDRRRIPSHFLLVLDDNGKPPAQIHLDLKYLKDVVIDNFSSFITEGCGVAKSSNIYKWIQPMFYTLYGSGYNYRAIFIMTSMDAVDELFLLLPPRKGYFDLQIGEFCDVCPDVQQKFIALKSNGLTVPHRTRLQQFDELFDAICEDVEPSDHIDELSLDLLLHRTTSKSKNNENKEAQISKKIDDAGDHNIGDLRASASGVMQRPKKKTTNSVTGDTFSSSEFDMGEEAFDWVYSLPPLIRKEKLPRMIIFTATTADSMLLQQHLIFYRSVGAATLDEKAVAGDKDAFQQNNVRVLIGTNTRILSAGFKNFEEIIHFDTPSKQQYIRRLQMDPITKGVRSYLFFNPKTDVDFVVDRFLELSKHLDYKIPPVLQRYMENVMQRKAALTVQNAPHAFRETPMPEVCPKWGGREESWNSQSRIGLFKYHRVPPPNQKAKELIDELRNEAEEQMLYLQVEEPKRKYQLYKNLFANRR